VVAGDTLFFESFSLGSFVNFFESLPRGASLITYYELSDHNEVAKRGVIELSAREQNRVAAFLEKPDPESTTSNKACPPLYLYSRQCLPLLEQFIKENGQRREALDAPGSFVSWLHSRAPVYAMRVDGRFDIGNLEDYEATSQHFTSTVTNSETT